MEPTSFKEANVVLDPPPGVDLEDCSALSVYKGLHPSGQPIVISCWKMTKDEVEEFQRTGRVWLWIWGHTMPPSSLSINNPFRFEPNEQAQT